MRAAASFPHTSPQHCLLWQNPTAVRKDSSPVCRRKKLLQYLEEGGGKARLVPLSCKFSRTLINLLESLLEIRIPSESSIGLSHNNF